MTPVEILKNEYQKRRKKNARYSMRSFSRTIGIDQSLLSRIMSGKRSLTSKQAIRVANRIALPEHSKKALIGLQLNDLKKPDFLEMATEFDLSWIDVALMDMIATRGFKPDPEYIAKRLKVSAGTVIESLAHLEKKALVRYDGDQLVKTNRKIHFCPEKSQKYIRQYHRDMVQKAAVELEKTDAATFMEQDFRGITMSIDPAKFPEAKKRLKEFIEEMGAFLSEGDSSEVYQLNTQLFSLTAPK